MTLSEAGQLYRVLARLKDLEPLAAAAELTWFARVESQLEDAQAALRWALARGLSVEGLELAVLLARYWWVVGRRREGRGWLEAFLDADAGAWPELRERARWWLGELAGEDDTD